MPTTTIAGVTVKDRPLADLLRSAVAQGFRLEPATNGGHPTGSGLVAYPPDPDAAPVRFGVEQVNPKHVRNVRANLRRVGFLDGTCTTCGALVHATVTTCDACADGNPTTTPAPAPAAGTAPTTPPEDTDMTRRPGSPRPGAKRKPEHDHLTAEQFVSDPTVDHETRCDRIGELTKALGDAAGMSVEDSGLLGLVVRTMASWGLDPEVMQARASLHATAGNAEVAEALRLAGEAEDRAVAAEAARERAEAKEQQARKDCADAIARAKAAEAEAARVTAALKPLRALLGEG